MAHESISSLRSAPRQSTRASVKTPPPSIPMAFFEAAFVGLVGCGIALIIARSQGVADPTSDPTVAAAHLGLLATLSMGLLGAWHQFVPVVTQKAMRSVRLAGATFVTWLFAAWLLPLGIGFENQTIVEVGGILAATSIVLLITNLWPPLRAKGKGAPVIGLRFAIAGFALTASFGVVYVFDRQGNWFDLSGHVVLAHASIGLLAWLGLTYVSVAERLYPMFFLSHVPGKRRLGLVAVSAVPTGVLLFAPGLLFNVAPIAWLGGAIVASGLCAHLLSLAFNIRHRNRKVDLYFVFVVTAETFMLVGVALAIASAVAVPANHHRGTMLAAAAVAALGGWVLEAFVGHIHKVIPFVEWSMFRSRGVQKNLAGSQLMFADLYDHTAAAVVYAVLTAGIASVCIGFATSTAFLLGAGGILLAVSGILLIVNLSSRSIKLLKASS